ncbi:MAG TPA: ComF family protein [Candidatus Limnocylindria bacterium]|jgi:ComF family protein
MGLLDVLLPPACAGCGRYGRIFCPACHGSLERASDDRDRFIAPDPGVVVGDALEVAVAAFRYGGPLRRALASLKYGGAARVAGPLAAASGPALKSLTALASGATLVPVPVHPERLRQRGYNQAALLAVALGGSARLPVADVLLRRRPTTQQHRLDRAARLRNLRDAFALHQGRAPPAAAILVDDILTTSATLEACAGVLRAAGCQRVLGFAVAREI